MDIKKEHNSLTEKTIKAHLKHLGLKVKNGFIYKNDWACYTEPLERRAELLSFLEGASAVFDNKGEWFK